MRITFPILFLFMGLLSCAQTPPQGLKEIKSKGKNDVPIVPGAQRTSAYIPKISGKAVAIVANQTATVGTLHLVDSLQHLGINIKKVFAPEHGFRGDIEGGEKFSNYKDAKSGLQVISLYGNHTAPTAAELTDVDVVIFDIQDVGVRFYTYLSTLHYVMQSCAENNKILMILDRPNPNGFYVDGPVLDMNYASFVGVDPVPVVHGCTMGEMAKMINGEKWLKNGVQCTIDVIPCTGWTHSDFYIPPIPPSPNLRTLAAIYLYPSLGLFEGTMVSVGRGTDQPFETIGFPGFKNGTLKFTPKSMRGIAEHPPYLETECKGINLRQFGEVYIRNIKSLYLFWLKGMYEDYPEKTKYFNSYFNSLAGNNKLQDQVITGKSEEEIRKSWEPELGKYKEMRKKYLLYPDFE